MLLLSAVAPQRPSSQQALTQAEDAKRALEHQESAQAAVAEAAKAAVQQTPPTAPAPAEGGGAGAGAAAPSARPVVARVSPAAAALEKRCWADLSTAQVQRPRSLWLAEGSEVVCCTRSLRC